MALFVDIEKKLGSFHLQVKFEADNSVLALLGASGCGKSMTLKCIAGIVRPDRGRIVLDGRTLFDSEKHINLPPQKRRVGYLFQQYALFPSMTVEQNIACGVRKKKEKAAAVQEVLRLMHLQELGKLHPHQLSGGQQQRVALARILVNEPDVLLLDEPFSALDSHLRFQLEQEVRQIIHRFGKTVLLVSHDRDEVYRFSSNIAILKDGKLDAMGSKHAVFAEPMTVNGAVLTGCKNTSPIRRVDDTHVFAENWGVTLKVPAIAPDMTHIGIRMHDITVGDGENALDCEVAEQIENPFSFTVMLHPVGSKMPGVIGMELSKADWQAVGSDRLTVCLPPQAILLLKD